MLVAALNFSVIAGNGPHVFFKPLHTSHQTRAGNLYFDCEGGGADGGAGAGLEINDELMFKQQTAEIR